MNALQYKIVKSVLAVGADPVKFAKMCKADPMEFIKVQTTDNYAQYKDEDTSMEDLMSMFMGGKK